MAWEYSPVIPPAQRLAGLDVFAGRMPVQPEALRGEIESALRDPRSTVVGMPRTPDHWADCLIAAKEILETDRPRGVKLMSGPVGSLLVMGATIALLYVQGELRGGPAAAAGKISWEDIRTKPPAELASGLMGSVDRERHLAANDRLTTARAALASTLYGQ